MLHAVANAQLKLPHQRSISVFLARNSSWNAVLSRCSNGCSGLCAPCEPRDSWEVFIPLSLKPALCLNPRQNIEVPTHVILTLICGQTYGYFLVWCVWCRWYWGNVAWQQLLLCGFAFGLCSGQRVFMTDSDPRDKCRDVTAPPFLYFLSLGQSKICFHGLYIIHLSTFRRWFSVFK